MRTPKKSDLKLAIREQARQKVRPTSGNVGADKGYREKVEAGRRQLAQISAEGGDTRAKKLKNELTYLLNNYTPSHDVRIEHLIDEWRRSGDPSYDPNIRLRLRQARISFQSRSNPI